MRFKTDKTQKLNVMRCRCVVCLLMFWLLHRLLLPCCVLFVAPDPLLLTPCCEPGNVFHRASLFRSRTLAFEKPTFESRRAKSGLL